MRFYVDLLRDSARRSGAFLVSCQIVMLVVFSLPVLGAAISTSRAHRFHYYGSTGQAWALWAADVVVAAMGVLGARRLRPWASGKLVALAGKIIVWVALVQTLWTVALAITVSVVDMRLSNAGNHTGQRTTAIVAGSAAAVFVLIGNVGHRWSDIE